MSVERKPAGSPESAKDLNQLLHAHQREVMRASSARTSTARENHFGKVAQIAGEIRMLRKISPKAGLPEPNSEPHTIIYGSYAGASASEVPSVSSTHLSDSASGVSENPDQGHADD
jgi:hypothetical protein